MTATEEQQAVVEAVRRGALCQVRAFAGTGKTETARLATHALPGRRILYLAFNRVVAAEARGRFPGWVTCRTAHSLAFAAEGRPFQGRLVTTVWALRPAVPPASLHAVAHTGGLSPTTAFALIVDALNTFCHSPDLTVLPHHLNTTGLAHVPVGRRPATVAAAVQAASALWARVSDPSGSWPTLHDVYLKRWQLTHPALPYDVILLDEAQDADPVLLDVLRHQRQAQLVVIGDPYQAIYGWRGAVDSLQRWRHEILPLTQSWRFGPALADRPNRVLQLLGESHRLIGANPHPQVGGPRAIIGRTHVGLVSAAENLFAGQGERVAVVGGAEPLARLLRDGYALWQGIPVHHPDLVWFPTWDTLHEAAESGVGALQPLITLVEHHRHTVPALAHRLGQRTVPEDQATVVLTTAHKAKGREWTHVTCLDDFAWPRDLSGREEAHLIYVALTRGRATCEAPAVEALLAHAKPLAPAVPRAAKAPR